jgi:hypothetical protein
MFKLYAEFKYEIIFSQYPKYKTVEASKNSETVVILYYAIVLTTWSDINCGILSPPGA